MLTIFEWQSSNNVLAIFSSLLFSFIFFLPPPSSILIPLFVFFETGFHFVICLAWNLLCTKGWPWKAEWGSPCRCSYRQLWAVHYRCSKPTSGPLQDALLTKMPAFQSHFSYLKNVSKFMLMHNYCSSLFLQNKHIRMSITIIK